LSASLLEPASALRLRDRRCGDGEAGKPDIIEREHA
jgi:hypothetical protein